MRLISIDTRTTLKPPVELEVGERGFYVLHGRADAVIELKNVDAKTAHKFSQEILEPHMEAISVAQANMLRRNSSHLAGRTAEARAVVVPPVEVGLGTTGHHILHGRADVIVRTRTDEKSANALSEDLLKPYITVVEDAQKALRQAAVNFFGKVAAPAEADSKRGNAKIRAGMHPV